jgi:hypothetical protein
MSASETQPFFSGHPVFYAELTVDIQSNFSLYQNKTLMHNLNIHPGGIFCNF